MTTTASTPTTPNTAVKMLSMNVLLNCDSGIAQPVIRAAVAGLGQVGSEWNGGEVLLKYPQHSNWGHGENRDAGPTPPGGR